MSYLLSFLKGIALKLIKHLSISSENYECALDLLKEEFLDLPFIVNDTLLRLVSMEPKDFKFESAQKYFTEVKVLICELANQGIVFLTDEDEENACGKLLSCIIFNKLPNLVKRELIAKALNSYPTLNNIFSHYNEVIKILISTSKNSGEKGKPFFDKKSNFKHNKKANLSPKRANRNMSEKPFVKGESVNTNFNNNYTLKPCKLCAGLHSMNRCEKYPDFKTRMARCKELTMCSRC
jgi:hypothetical protein